MRARWIVYALLFSVAINVAAVGTLVYHLSKPSKGERWRRRPDFPRSERPVLKLSEEQRQELRELRKVYFEKLRPLREEVRRERAELVRLLEQPTVDSAKVDEVISRMAKAQAEMEKQTAMHFVRLKAVLTPEQMESFHRVIRDRMGPFGRDRKPGAEKPKLKRQRPEVRGPQQAPHEQEQTCF